MSARYSGVRTAAGVLACLMLASGCAAPAATPAGVQDQATPSPAASAEAAPTVTSTPAAQPTATATSAPTPDPLVITGSITNSDGTPAVGVALFADSQPVTPPGEVDAKTGADGTFSLKLGEGHWCFAAVTPVGQMTFAPSGWVYKADANCLDIGASAYPPINLKIPAGTRVTGTVLDLDGKPVADQMLTADSSTMSNTTTTDGKGRFSLLLVPGTYKLAVETEAGTTAWKKVTVGKAPITGIRVTGGA